MTKLSGLIIFISVFCFGCASTGITDVAKHVDMLSNTAKAAQTASRAITDEEEYYIGRAVAARILSQYKLLSNKKLTDYVNTVGISITLYSQRPYTHGGYHFAVLDTEELNALACPGGVIFITKGMLKMAKNEDELAAVLAHEIVHISQRDGLNAIKKSRWTEALTIIGTSAAKHYGPAELSQLVNIFEGSIDDVFKTLVVNGYGRAQERNADMEATQYLSRAGYNPGALREFLERISAGNKGTEGGILKTHPGTSERIENVKENISALAIPDNSMIKKRTERFVASTK